MGHNGTGCNDRTGSQFDTIENGDFAFCRIDGAVAMCMALGLLDQLQAAGLIYRSVYEDSDVLIL